MLPKNFERIDEKIRNLIVIINRISFLETTTSCAGHPERKKNVARIAITVHDEEKWFDFIEKNIDEIERDEEKNLYKIFFQTRFFIESKKLKSKNWMIIIKPLDKRNSHVIRKSLDAGIKKLEELFSSLTE